MPPLVEYDITGANDRMVPANRFKEESGGAPRQRNGGPRTPGLSGYGPIRDGVRAGKRRPRLPSSCERRDRQKRSAEPMPEKL